MNQKGQLSFEFLLLTVIIFSLAIMVSGYHFAEQDTTNAMIIAKSETLSWLNEKSSLYYIEKVDFNPLLNTMTIDLSDNSFNASEINLLKDQVKKSVENSTGLVNILIDVI